MGAVVLVVAMGSGCLSGTEIFIGDRLVNLCNESYFVCDVSAGCSLDDRHYAEGSFPGARRVVVMTETPDQPVQVRLYLDEMQSSGTELLVQLLEPDCTLESDTAEVHLEEIDVLEEAGQDRTIRFDLVAEQPGEHVLEIFSDARADYLLIADLIPAAF